MNKKENFLYRNRFIIISFFAAMFTMLMVYLITGVYPLGKNTVLRMDLYHQYGPLFAELVDKIKSGSSLTYSWASGLGSCFLGNYFNYLSSPIGAIVVFFGHEHVTEAIAVMILIKAALSAASFTFYLKKSQHNHSLVTASFGILYAFCGYMLAYYWNVMWLDAMILLPIVLLGIERIINNGSIWTYFIGLALSFFANYYMSYMLCIFAVIYFLYYYTTNYSHGAVVDSGFKPKKRLDKLRNNRFWRSGLQFAGASIMVAGLLAFMLIPVYNILSSSSATSNTFPSEFKSYFKFFDFLANHFASLETTIRSSGEDVLPNIYCGVLTIILAPLFFFTKSISKKEKVTTLALLSVLFVSFNTNFLNFIWHGMHWPNDLPYRFSFIYSFILLLIAYKTFIRLNEFTSKQIGVIGAAIVAFAIITEKVTSKNVSDSSVYITIIFTVFYVLLLTLFKDKKYEIASLAVMLCVCTCSEAIIADTAAFPNNIERESYVSDYSEFNEIKDKLDTIENDSFYRMELTNLRTRMDPCWYGYNGVSVFSSMAYDSVAKAEKKLGMMGNNINSYTYNPQTPVYNMMHSLKYIVNNSTPNILSDKYYTYVTEANKYQAYSNNYYLPIAFCTNKNIADWKFGIDDIKSTEYTNPFNAQGDFFDKATGAGNPFVSVPISYISYNNVEPFTEDLNMNSFYYQKTTADTDASAVFNVTAQKKGNIYIAFQVDGGSEKSITINSKYGTISHNAGQYCLLDLGSYDADDSISITIPFENNSGNVKLYAATIDNKILDKGYKKLSNEAMSIDKFENNLIEGTVTAKTDRVLYTSIPFDYAWNVYIDGEKVSFEDMIKIGDAFLAVNLKKGNHTIKLEYKAPALGTGIKISAVFALILILYVLSTVLKKRKGKPSKRPQFKAIDHSYNEIIIIEPKAAKKSASTVRSLAYPTADLLPKREIIMPTKVKPVIKREVIAPPVKADSQDVSEENVNINTNDE